MNLTRPSFLIIAVISLLFSLNVWARGGGGCFVAGTSIATPNGDKPIQSLQVGDTVWSRIQGVRKIAKVVATTKVDPDHYLEVTVADAVLDVTDEHLIAITRGVFRKAINLHVGDRIVSWRQHHWQKLPILSISRVKINQPAYNLLVDRGATYFANSVLVHNKGCFLPETPVLKSDGSSVAISRIVPGDLVKAYNSDGTILTTTVKNVLTHKVDTYYTVITANRVLNVTGEHPFYIGNGTFKTVEALHVADEIYVLEDNKLSPQKILQMRQVKQTTLVYNLQTDEPHTYFASGVAVHNKGGGCFPAGTKVTTPAGPMSIELLAPGNEVISIDQIGRKYVTRIQSVFATRSAILQIETNHGILQTTAEHPIATESGQFILASELKLHDKIRQVIGNKIVLAEVSNLKKLPVAYVYNLQVDSPHTFIADNFLVHNKGGGSFRSGSSGRTCAANDAACQRESLIGLGSLAIFFIISFFAGRTKKDNNKDELDVLFTLNQIRAKSVKTVKLVNFIARQDDTFKPDLLLTTTKSVFIKLQSCWTVRDYQPMKELLMPDLFEQHTLQIDGMIHNHEINQIDNLKVDAIYLVNVRYTENRNQREFTALISAQARDFYLDDRTNVFLRGDKSIAKFQEFWTFHFQDGQWYLREIEQTAESSYLKDENFCEMFTDAQIEKIYEGKVDDLGDTGAWVTKPVAGKLQNVERMLNFLVRSDSAWQQQEMLKRVRSVFTNVHMALEAGTLSDDVKCQLFPAVATDLTERLDAWKTLGNSIEYRNFCIRKVEIVLARSFADKSTNEFVARICAHAQRIQTRNGRIASEDPYVTYFEEYWTFGRLDNEWKLKEALPSKQGEQAMQADNIEEDTSPDLVKWYYTKKRSTL